METVLESHDSNFSLEWFQPEHLNTKWSGIWGCQQYPYVSRIFGMDEQSYNEGHRWFGNGRESWFAVWQNNRKWDWGMYFAFLWEFLCQCLLSLEHYLTLNSNLTYFFSNKQVLILLTSDLQYFYSIHIHWKCPYCTTEWGSIDPKQPEIRGKQPF